MAKFPTGSVVMGLVGVVLGLLVVALGYVVVPQDGNRLSQVLAGTTVVVGLSVALVSAFLLLLPPLLPAR